jgi:hypothetical protein
VYLRWLFYFSAVVGLIFGLGFLLAPDLVATSYGGKLDPTATTLAQFWGATLLPLAWVSWIAASTVGSALKLVLVRANVLTAIIEVVVTYLAASAGVISTTGAITNYVLSAIFAIGFGYYGWAKTAAATT